MGILNKIKNFLWPQKEIKPLITDKQTYRQYLPDLAGVYYWVISRDVKVDLFDSIVVEAVYLYFDGKFGVFRIGDAKRYQREDFIWLSYCFSAPKNIEEIIEALRDGTI